MDCADVSLRHIHYLFYRSRKNYRYHRSSITCAPLNCCVVSTVQHMMYLNPRCGRKIQNTIYATVSTNVAAIIDKTADVTIRTRLEELQYLICSSDPMSHNSLALVERKNPIELLI